MPIAAGVSAVANSASNTVTTGAVTSSASGSTFVIGVSFDAGTTVSTVGDSKSNSYTLAGTTITNGGQKIALYYSQNGTGGSSHTATVTFSGTAYPSLFFLEITGAATASFDVTGSATGDSTSPFGDGASTGTLSQANELIVSLIGSTNADTAITYTAGGGFTRAQQTIDGGNYWTGAIGYLVVSSTASVSGNWTISPAGTPSAGVILAAFKEAAGGGGGAQLSGRNGLALANISEFNGLAKASVSAVNGITTA